MTKRTVKFDISVSGSAVVDVHHLLKVLRKSDQHPWAQHLIDVYNKEGADALVQAYVKQAYSGGVNSLLREWANGGEPEAEHGGRAKFSPAQCVAVLKPKPKLYPKDVPIGGHYKFLNPLHGLYKGRFLRLDDNHSQCENGEIFAWEGHETHLIELVV